MISSTRVEQSIAMIGEVAVDRTRMALPHDRLTRIDRALAADWGIDFSESSSLEELMPRVSDSGSIAAYWDAHDHVANLLRLHGSRPLQEHEFAGLYDALSAPDVLGPVTSQRRALILDAIALSVGLAERLDLRGAILDVGCHSGFSSSVVAAELRRPVVGIDPSAKAIEVARGHRAKGPDVSFEVARIPWETQQRFDVVLAIDSMPATAGELGPFLRGIGEVLNAGGLAVIVSMRWDGADTNLLKKYLKAAKLGFAFTDVVGGYMGFPANFDQTEAAVVLVKGGEASLPRRLSDVAYQDWPHFQEFANSPLTPKREKTQAFERSLRRFGR